MTDATETIEYWLVSVPNSGDEQRATETLRRIVEPKQAEFSLLSEIPVKDLRVGTLDTLIALSDELGKIDNSGKNITAKLHRTYRDLENPDSQNALSLNIQQKSMPGYIRGFKWDEGHFNPRANLKDLVQMIHGNMQKNAEHLRKRSAKLAEIESNLQQIVRKKSGSLMNKSLKEFVTQEDWCQGDYIGTALVVVPKQKRDDFVSTYEFFEDNKHDNDKYEKFLHNKEVRQAEIEKDDNNPNSNNDNNNDDNEVKTDAMNNDNDNNANGPSNDHDNPNSSKLDNSKGAFNFIKERKCRIVVPDSAKLLAEDAEFGLYRVVLLNHGYNWFKFMCREKGFVVRDFEFTNENDDDDEKMVTDLTKQKATLEKKLKLFCQNTFSETFANWMHLKVIRCFVEAVLRFGLPVDFSVSCIKPPRGQEKKLLKFLDIQYNHLVDKKFQGGNDTNELDFSGLSGEFHPYVYIPLKLDL